MNRLFLIPILVAGCAAPPPQGDPPPKAPLALEGPVWRLAEIDGAAVEDDTLMVFDDGKLTGQGPCNALQATYAYRGTAFSVDAIATTQKACANLAEENRMLDGMLMAQTAELRGERLRISSAGGPALTFDLGPR